MRISVRHIAVLRGSLAAATAAGLLAGLALAAPVEAATATTQSSPSSAHARLPLSAARMQADRRLHDAAEQATSTVTGIVRTAGGSPLAGVCVTAYGPAGEKSAVTNAAGRYFISGLRGGRYRFGYRSCAGSATAYLPEWYGSVLQRGESRPVVLDSSTLRRVQPLAAVTLYAADSNLGGLGDLGGRASVAPEQKSDVVASDPFGSHRQVPASAVALAQSVFADARRAAHSGAAAASAKAATGTISGVVTSPSGQGLKGMCVEAGSPVTGAVGKATTGTGGRYHVKVPTGAYEMLFYTGCGNFGNWLFQIYKNIYNPLKEPTVVTVRKSHPTTINAVMKLGGAISGTVKGPQGQKLSGICVTPLLVHGSDELYFTAVAHNGVYHARALPPGTYQLGFAPCRNAKYAPTLWPDTQSYRAASVLTVQRGTVISNIDEVMQPGGTVTGTITSATTPPASLAGICVLVEEDGGLYASGVAATMAPGRYTVKGLPPGRYTIVAFPGCYVESNYVEATYPRKVAVYTGATESDVNVALPVGDIISGTVTSATTGKPVAGICVAISQRNGTIVDGAASAQDGTYSVNQLAAGKYEVQFAGGCGNTGSYAPQGYDNTNLFDPQILTFASSGESLNAVDAAMQPGPRISGIVRDTSGERLSGICVEAVTPADIVFAAAVTISGTYHLTNLAPGQYQVIFGPGCGNSSDLLTEWYPSQLSPAATISASSGTVTGINAHLPPAGAISGEVRTASGKRVSSSCLVLTGLSGMAKGLVGDILLDDARYELAGVPTGRWQVAFVPACAGLTYATQYYKDQPGPAFASAITVRPLGMVRNVSSKLVAGGSISGRLTSQGKPASQVCVTAQNISVVDDFGGATTNSKGDYTIYGLNSGTYELEASPCGPHSSGLSAAIVPKAVRVSAPRNTGHVNDRLGLAGTITGQVLGGSPATTQPNVCVEAIPASGLGGGATTTNRSGNYAIAGLTPGNFTIYVGDPSCTYGDQDLAPLWYPDATTRAAAQAQTVAAGATTAVSPVTLAGDGSITGTVTQTGGAALHGVCVAATQVSPAPGLPVYSVSGSDGSYSITDLPPGTYRVGFSSGCGANGYQTQWWNDESSRISATPVSVTPGTATTSVSAVLSK